jgi:hypothetical protein
MKLVRLIKMCLNETYSKVRIGKNLSDNFPGQNGIKQGRCFIATAFQLCFRICLYEGPEILGGAEIKWDTSAASLS